MVTLTEGTLLCTIALTEIAYYGIKTHAYCLGPNTKSQLKKEIRIREERGESFPRLRAYAPYYLPFPFDMISERNSMEIMRT
ncbi:MAG: hypothetical protein KJ697_05190 [Nanoarchaeota archaeon]|nr:hypothetical protein [Nanoarchaeota archaeon]MBU4124392.1 hypothetical protein [Nanoarchaeota archaeon]